MEKHTEYRDNLARDLKDIRKHDPEKARGVLEAMEGTSNFQEAEQAHRSEQGEFIEQRKLSKIEAELNNELEKFEHGKFNIYHAKELSPEQVQELTARGYKFEKDVYISLGESSGYELLKALSEEQKAGNQELTVYVVNEVYNPHYNFRRVETSPINVPFTDQPPVKPENAGYKTGSVTDIMELAESADIKELARGVDNASFYKTKELYQDALQAKENKSDLLKEWAEYLKDNFDRSGWKSKTHHSEYFEMHLTTQVDFHDKEQLEKLYSSFLEQKNIKLVKTSEIGEVNKAIPLATESYHLLINRPLDNYDHLEVTEDGELKYNRYRPDSLRSGFAANVAKELITRPEAINNPNLHFSKNWREGRV
jgi:hypothetical protein